jgi:putative peptide zinc metalloprotease protein
MNADLHTTGTNILGYRYEALHVSPGEFVLSYNRKYYRIGEAMYEILKAGAIARNMDEMHGMVNEILPITKTDLHEIIDTKILPVFKSAETPSAEMDTGFWLKRKLLSSASISLLARPLLFLFGKLFYPLFFFICILNAWLYYQAPAVTSGAFLQDYEVATWALSYLALFAVIFLHEMGHAAAAIASGIHARNIGLGFYTVLPVMYTDLTDTWKLPKKDKVKINLAGIFMQLLVNGLLLFLVKTGNDFVAAMSWKIYLVNNCIILINLVPFMKFDGYWILSDMMAIPNLIRESNQKLVDLFTKKDPFPEENDIGMSRLQRVFIAGYAFLRVVFIGSVIFIVFAFIWYSIVKTILFIRFIPYLELNFTVAAEMLKRIGSIVIIFLFTRKYRKMFFRLILKKRK